jgi:hypothetical protein
MMEGIHSFHNQKLNTKDSNANSIDEVVAKTRDKSVKVPKVYEF